MKRLSWLLLLCCLTVAGPGWAATTTNGALLTELGSDYVKLTSDFTGQTILVFGTTSQAGNVIIKVVSPSEPVNLSHKIKIGPFWVNGAKVAVHDAPALVQILSSAPLDKLLGQSERDRYGLNLKDALTGAKAANPPPGLGDWRSALLELKKRSDHYQIQNNAVHIMHQRLFRATFRLPADIPLGNYRVHVYLVKGGHIFAHQTLQLHAMQMGMEHRVVHAARHVAWTFGIGLTLFALFFGLGFSILLRLITRG